MLLLYNGTPPIASFQPGFQPGFQAIAGYDAGSGGYAFPPQRTDLVDWDALLRKPDPLVAPEYQMRSAVAFGWAASARLAYNDDELLLELLTGDAL